MRIVAGKYRRRKLLANPGLQTRPITDRVKETLFERLHGEIEGARVADIFAGTGTLGFEALSRDAHSVVFFESDRRAYDLLHKNVDALGVAEETLCWRVDVLRTSFRPKGVESFLPYDVLFFDPPYRMVADLQEGSPMYKAIERLARDDVSSANAVLMFRTPSEARFTMPPVWKETRMLDFGSMQIFLNTKEGPSSPPGQLSHDASISAAPHDSPKTT